MPFDYSLLFLFLVALLALLVFLLVRSVYYARKSQKKYEEKRVPSEDEKEVAPGDAVKAVLIQRIEAIKNKDARVIARLVDRDRYTKFDDWPPFERQSLDALKREADALKVLKEYDYETTNWKIDVFGDAAIASFTLNYRGMIRKLKFNIHSRITAFLLRREGDWKLVHEHWSRFPMTKRNELTR